MNTEIEIKGHMDGVVFFSDVKTERRRDERGTVSAAVGAVKKKKRRIDLSRSYICAGGGRSVVSLVYGSAKRAQWPRL